MRVQSIAADLGVQPNYDQFYTRAICHGDRDSSGLSIGAKDDKGSSSRDGYPLMTCHAGCTYPTIRAALIDAGVSSAWMRPTGQPAQSAAAKKATAPVLTPRSEEEYTQKYVPDDIWLRAHDALFGTHSDKLAYLVESRGLTKETVRSLCIGWHKGRYSIPVFDDRGCVTLRLYKPDGKPKIKYLNGYGQNRLYIPGDSLAETQRTLYCAGEWDAILAHQNGWQSVTHTGGESAAPPAVDLALLAGQHVVVAYDNDDAGRAGAQKTAEAVAPLARKVLIADLSPFVGTKGDVGDLLLSGQGLGRALAAAEPWVREVGGRREVDWAEFWANDPEPIRYLIDPLFAAGEVTRVFAPAKVGKSLLVLEAMAALATGREVLGKTTAPTHVVYVDQENTPDDWRDRLESMGYDASDDMSRLHWYSLQSWPPLDTADGGEALLRTVQEHLAEVVVIDTQSKVLEGPEDKSDTAAAFYRHTLLPMKRMGCAVVIIDHAGNDESKPRGTSGKRDDVDVVWRVSRSGDAIALARTHTRKPHEVDRLSLRRELGPTRHVVRNKSAEPSHAFESRVEACMEVIAFLDLPPHPSGRAVTQAIRESPHKFENKVISEAWNRLKETLGGEK